MSAMFLDDQSCQLDYGELLSWLVEFGFVYECASMKVRINELDAYIEDRSCYFGS